MAGMISMALVRGDEAAKVGENAQAKLLAFFRMELASEERIGRDARSERSAVIRRRRYDGAVVRNDVEGMNKIDIVAVGDSFQKRRVGFLFDAVPAHVRHFEIFAGAKAHNFSGKEIKPLLPSEFLALGKKQLEAEADAEEEFFCCTIWRICSIKPNLPRFSMQALKAPTPGSTTPRAERIWPASRVTKALKPTRSRPFCTLRRLP